MKLCIELEIDCLDEQRENEALELVDTLLENGVPQDSINEPDEDECPACFGRGSIVGWHVKSAVVRRVG